MSIMSALDIESEFDPSEIESKLVGAKELRIWHWALAMYFRRCYNQCESNVGYPDREMSMIHFDKMVNFHIKACNILNDVLPPGTTGESDLAEYVLSKKKAKFH